MLHKPQTLKLVKNEYFWHMIPLPIVYKYVQDKEKITKIKRLVKENKVCHSLYYKKDLGLKDWSAFFSEISTSTGSTKDISVEKIKAASNFTITIHSNSF